MNINYYNDVIKNNEENGRQCFDIFSQEKPFQVLTKEIADQMVDKIEIYNHKIIRVILNYEDVFEALAKEYLCNNES